MSSQRENPRDVIDRKQKQREAENHQDYMNMVNADQNKKNAANGSSGGCVVLLFAISSSVVAALFSIYKILG